MKTNKPKYSSKDNFQPYLEQISDNFEKCYIENRVLNQISWYSSKASKNQTFFKRWMMVSIILSSSIPVFTMLSDYFFAKILITVISSSITVISSIISLYHFQDLWVKYRSTCEILKSILHRYFTHTGEFEKIPHDFAFNILVMSCEEYMTKEFQTWTAINTPKSDNQSSSPDSSITNS